MSRTKTLFLGPLGALILTAPHTAASPARVMRRRQHRISSQRSSRLPANFNA
jgi:hypothetical protein